MIRRTWLALASSALAASAITAPVPQPAHAQTAEPIAVGAAAPDFALPGATRYGVLRDPVRLSDFKGKTVVLAFFFKARTPG